MLSRRFSKLLKIVERRTILQLYVAGNNVHSNLLTHRINATRNLYNFSGKMIMPILRGKERSIEKQSKITTRSLSRRTDDDNTDDQVSENNLAHALLKSSKRNFKTLRTPLQPTESLSADEVDRILCEDWTNLSVNEVVKAFEQLSHTAKLKSECLNEREHSHILDALSAKLSELNDEQLRLIFGCLSLWHRIMATKFPAYTHFWMQLDGECSKRLAFWNTEEALLMCDYWFSIRLTKKSSFVMSVLKNLGKKPKQLNPTNFLHYMFIINTCRKPPINVYELEYYLTQILDQYNANELGIIAMAFFKCQTPIRDQNVITSMQRKMIEDIDNLQDVCIGAIMKITRYSTGLRDLKVFQHLLTKLEPQVPNLSIPCLTNMMHAAAAVQAYNPKLVKAVITSFEKNISQTRIKDLERLAWALGIFDHDTDAPIYHKILESLRDPRREAEFALYPKSIPTILCHFSFANIFPLDLIKKSFDPEFLSRVYENNAFKIGWDLFALENNIKIDFPEYDGPFLEPTILQYLAKKFSTVKTEPSLKSRNADKFIMQVAHMCKSAVKPNTPITVDQILPHYAKPDIILCFDDESNPVDPQPILSGTSGTKKDYIKYVPDEAKHLKWIAVVLATQNLILKGEDRYAGPLNAKVRQYEKIGYTPIIMNIHEWDSLSSVEMKCGYLRRKLYSVINRKISATANSLS